MEKFVDESKKYKKIKIIKKKKFNFFFFIEMI